MTLEFFKAIMYIYFTVIVSLIIYLLILYVIDKIKGKDETTVIKDKVFFIRKVKRLLKTIF
jgi:hypothetical protein